jgi:hypothetical protein
MANVITKNVCIHIYQPKKKYLRYVDIENDTHNYYSKHDKVKNDKQKNF